MFIYNFKKLRFFFQDFWYLYRFYWQQHVCIYVYASLETHTARLWRAIQSVWRWHSYVWRQHSWRAMLFLALPVMLWVSFINYIQVQCLFFRKYIYCFWTVRLLSVFFNFLYIFFQRTSSSSHLSHVFSGWMWCASIYF